MTRRERAKQLYEHAMRSQFSPVDAPSWSGLTWTEQAWWEHIADCALALNRPSY